MAYKIRFPVGDWSSDGHGKCEYFFVESRWPVEDVRKIHHQGPEVLGFDIDEICRNYEENTLSDDIMNQLKARGFHLVRPRYFTDDDYNMDAEGVFLLWIDLLKYIEPKWEYVIPSDTYDDITFYGYDDQGRHISGPGYGVFY